MITKKCSMCGEEKPSTKEHFCVGKSYKDGLRPYCRVCNRKRDRQYWQKNREVLLQKRRHYYEENRHVFSEKNKVYRENNKESIREMKRQYSKTPKGREIDNVKVQRYQAREKNLPATFIVDQWRLCKSFFQDSCAYCGKPSKRLQQDHVVPVASGGGYVAENIVPTCRRCNMNKGKQEFSSWYSNYQHYSEERLSRIESYLDLCRQVSNKEERYSLLAERIQNHTRDSDTDETDT